MSTEKDLRDSSPTYIVITRQPGNNNIDKPSYAKYFLIESEALYNVNHYYFPVIIELDVESFSLKLNIKFPYQETLWSVKKLPKKDAVFNRPFSYSNISLITLECEYEHILIEFRGSDVSIRLCSSYLQLLLNQFYLKNKSIDIRWAPGIVPFPYQHPVITKLFFLTKQTETSSFTSETSPAELTINQYT